MSLKANAIEALRTLKKNASKIATDFPALAPFLPLAGILLHAVHIVEHETGHDTAGAVASVASTLTPGQANAPALTDPASDAADNTPIDGSHVDAASDAAEPDATVQDAVTAVQAIPDPTLTAPASS